MRVDSKLGIAFLAALLLVPSLVSAANVTLLYSGFQGALTDNFTASSGWSRTTGAYQDGSASALLTGGGGSVTYLTSVAVDTSSCVNVYVNFWTRDHLIDANDNAFFQMEGPDNTWTDTGTELGTLTEDTWVFQSITGTSTNKFNGFQVRFTDSGQVDAGETLGVDNVTIVCDDTTSPTITNVLNWSIDETTAKINWTTDDVANGSVKYGTTTALTGGAASHSSLLTAHNLNLSSLTPGTLYYYNVSSCDAAGNCNTTGPYNFTTAIESQPPVMQTSTINPSMATDAQNLTGYCNATDSDSSALFYDYTWYRDGVAFYQGIAFKQGAIDSGTYHTCGIRANDSRVLCWGGNSYGQLGNGDYNVRASPTLINDSAAYSSISAGEYHTCAIRTSDSRIICWGRNNYGQLANGSFEGDQPNPTPISDTSSYKSISARIYQTCAIRSNDSRVLCWGDNWNNVLGIGNDTSYAVPVATLDASPYKSISAGDYHTCGIRANDSRVLCWGSNGEGQLGIGNTTTIPYPIITNDTSAYLQVSASNWLTCGIRANDSRVLCWGYNSDGQLGNGSTGISIYSPRTTNDASPYLSVSAASYHVCGIRATDYRVLCWGSNDEGQLGTGNTAAYTSPTLINDSRAYASLVTHHMHTCGIRANDSRIVCWGRNDDGQLGNGSAGGYSKNPTLTTDSSSYSSKFNQSSEAEIPFQTHNSYTAQGENWTLRCQAFDGFVTSSSLNSTATSIVPPFLTINSVSATPNNPRNGTAINITTNITNTGISPSTVRAILRYPNGTNYLNPTYTIPFTTAGAARTSPAVA